jgi:serine/threonine protein kinase
MPVVIDDTAAVAGFIGLSVTLFAGCIKGFTILSDAWRFGQDASVVRCLLEVEQHRLNCWADAVGLLDEQARLPLDPKDILVVRNILESLASLLSDVQKLRRQYKLDLEVTNEEIIDLAAPDTTLGRLMLRTKPKFYQQAVQVFRKRNGPWKRLRWVVVDVDHARKLTEDINSMNDHLERFLPKGQSDALITSFEGMMRLLVVLSTDMQDLKAIAQRERYGSNDGAVAATARCKQEGLSLGVLNRSDTGDSTASTLLERSTSSLSIDAIHKDSPISRALELSADLLRLSEAVGTSSLRVLAQYDGEPVLVEWKLAGGAVIPKVRYRIERVSAFLNGLVHPSFHSLRCRGYFKDPDADRYGYVFDLPSELTLNDHKAFRPNVLPHMKTLRDCIRHRSPQPSLNDRISLAIALTETVLQLHTSGFLHKEIRSENILFFQLPHKLSAPSVDITSPYLAGYIYARADNPLEATETPEAQFEADLYRHPSSLGISRASYRKNFDLFSLGCVLLELGIWSRLSTILLQSVTQSINISHGSSIPLRTRDGQGVKRSLHSRAPSEHKSILNAKQQLLDPSGSRHFRGLLEASSGRVYADVVMACLYAEGSMKSGLEDGDEVADCTLDIQEKSLAQLRSIVI